MRNDTEITDQQDARKELEVFRKCMDRSGDAIFIIDPDTAQFNYVNESACTNLGYTREQLKDMTVPDIDPNVTDGQPEWDEHVRDVRRNGPITIESVHQRADGTVFPVEIQVDYLEVHNQSRMVATARDMTERKKEKRENELLLTLSQIVGESQDVDEAIEGLVRTICELEDCPAAELWQPNSNGSLECREVYQLSHSNQYSLHAEGQTMTFGRGEGLPGIVWAKQEPRTMTDLYENENFIRNRPARKDGLEEALGLPLIAGEELMGVVVLFRPKRKDANEFSVDRLQTVFKQLQPLFNRKRTEEKLHKSEQRLELAEELADLGHWSISLPEREVHWSDQIYRILGWDPSEPEPPLEEAFKLYHEDDRAEIQHKIEQAIEREEEFNFKLRIRRSDGEIRHVRSIGGPRYDEDGNLREIFGVFQDITDQKQTLQRLKESEQRFRQMAENINEGFSLMNADYERVHYINRATARIYGVSIEELYEDPTAWIRNIPDGEIPEIKKTIKRREPISEPHDREFRVIRGGETCWVRARFYPIRDEDGTITRVAGISTDITQRRRTQEKLQKKANFLEAVNNQLPGVTYQFKIRSGRPLLLPVHERGVRGNRRSVLRRSGGGV